MSFEFKLKTESVNQVSADVKALFNRVIANKQMLGEIGQSLVEDIKSTTQKDGKSIPLKVTDFKLLKESWILRKRKLSQTNHTDEYHEEGKSNLTFTGQLLNSIVFKIVSKGKLLFTFSGTHEGYVSESGQKGKNISNEKLAKYVAEQGRPFFGVRPVMRSRVSRIVKTYMKRAILVGGFLKGIDK